MEVYQFAEVCVDRDQDSVRRFGEFQKRPVPRVDALRADLDNVMPVAAKPFGQTTSSASVYEKPHYSLDETVASVSLEMTAWA